MTLGLSQAGYASDCRTHGCLATVGLGLLINIRSPAYPTWLPYILYWCWPTGLAHGVICPSPSLLLLAHVYIGYSGPTQIADRCTPHPGTTAHQQ